MNPVTGSPAADDHASLARQTLRLLDRRLLPFLLVLYVVAWLDRVNISFAALTMNRDLGFSDAVYGLGAGIFFIGYAMFEIPSNILLARVGARRWITRIMVTWGLLSIAMVWVHDASSFYLVRFLLGVAEAGFLPGIIYYLGEWYPRHEHARAVSWFMMAIPLSTVIGGPLAGVLLLLDGHAGLHGWQWLFLIEGMPAVLLGVAVWFYLDDSPAHARWLSDAQRGWLINELHVEKQQVAARHGITTLRALMHPVVWLLGLCMFAFQTGSYGLNLWIPQIIKGLSGVSNLMVSLLSAMPYAAAAVAMWWLGKHSDRTGERFWHVALPTLLGAVGFIACAVITLPWLGMVALTIAAVGDLSTRGPFWALPRRFLTGKSSAAGIALINTLGALGGFVGPYAVGAIKQATHSFAGGMVLLAGLLLFAAITVLCLRHVAVLKHH